MKGERIIIVRDYIRERTFEEFARDIYTQKREAVWYRRMNGRGILLDVQAISHKKIEGEKMLLIEMIIKTLYTKVKEFRKFLVVDPYHNLIEYTQDLSLVKKFGQTTKIFIIKDTPDEAIDKVMEKIKEIESTKNKT